VVAPLGHNKLLAGIKLLADSPDVPQPSRHLGLSAPDGLAHLEAFELGMPEIEGLVVSGIAMRGAECLGLGPRCEGRAALQMVWDA
jgi:hypothetical protein